MVKIDRRRSYYLVLDTETAGGLDNPLVYDLGFAITDRHGNIYEERSFIIGEIYTQKNLMNSAYYAEKLPIYAKDIVAGSRTIVPFMQAREELLKLAIKYNITTIGAYFFEFDARALNNTMQYITQNDKAMFLSRKLGKVKTLCIWCLACEVLYTQRTFLYKANKKGWLTDKGNISTTAEIGYRYVSEDKDFIEAHTGLEDVLIEIEIMARALRQNKKRRGGSFSGAWRIPNRKNKEILGL